MPDEVHDLIQQVEAKGGPLRVHTMTGGREVLVHDDPHYGNSAPNLEHVVTPWWGEVLAGVLRRDANERGITFVAIGSANGTTVYWNDGTDRDSHFGHSGLHATEHLHAHLLAWLDAANKLDWRRTPPRDDLYDGRMPIEDDDEP